jgi:hypothetical protein
MKIIQYLINILKFIYIYLTYGRKIENLILIIWIDLFNALETAEKFNHIELTKINEKIIKIVKENYKDLAESNNSNDVIVRKRKRKRRTEESFEIVRKDWKDSNYKKVMDNYLLQSINDLKKNR